MLELSIEIKGREWGDLELALQEVLKKVKEEYLSGGDFNEDGRYSFKITGEESRYCLQCDTIISGEPIRGEGSEVFCSLRCKHVYNIKE